MKEGWLRVKPGAVRIFSLPPLKLRTAEGPEFFVPSLYIAAVYDPLEMTGVFGIRSGISLRRREAVG